MLGTIAFWIVVTTVALWTLGFVLYRDQGRIADAATGTVLAFMWPTILIFIFNPEIERINILWVAPLVYFTSVKVGSSLFRKYIERRHAMPAAPSEEPVDEKIKVYDDDLIEPEKDGAGYRLVNKCIYHHGPNQTLEETVRLGSVVFDHVPTRSEAEASSESFAWYDQRSEIELDNRVVTERFHMDDREGKRRRLFLSFRFPDDSYVGIISEDTIA